jgi:hypothetical protein
MDVVTYCVAGRQIRIFNSTFYAAQKNLLPLDQSSICRITRCTIGDLPRPLPLRIIAPQSRSAMGKQMSMFNWRSSGAYDRAHDAEITGFAWECLRRNPGFQRDHRSASPASLTVSAEFRDRWGLVFRS